MVTEVGLQVLLEGQKIILTTLGYSHGGLSIIGQRWLVCRWWCGGEHPLNLSQSSSFVFQQNLQWLKCVEEDRVYFDTPFPRLFIHCHHFLLQQERKELTPVMVFEKPLVLQHWGSHHPGFLMLMCDTVQKQYALLS